MKTALVKLRIEPTEHADWTRQAEAADMSLSEWVRSLVNGEPTQPAAKTDKRTSRRNGGIVGAIENLTHDTLRKDPAKDTFQRRSHHPRCPCSLCQK